MSLNFFTSREIAKELRVSVSTIRRWIKEGVIPVIHVTKRKLLFDGEKVKAALSKKK